MYYLEVLNAVFLLADFVLKKVEENEELKGKEKEEIIKYFETKYADINKRLKPLKTNEK